MPDYDAQLAFAVELAHQAGAVARAHFSPELATTIKADDSPLTVADTAINALVIRQCQAHYPDISIIGEEQSRPGTAKGMSWVCDPIDGTLPYSLGIAASTFCLALVAYGEPVVGVIYDFQQDRLFSAQKGGPLLCNGQPLPPVTQAQRAVNLASSYRSRYVLHGLHARLAAARFGVLKFSSTALMDTKVLEGRLAASIYAGTKPWDVAASKVMAEAAGCLMTDLEGREQRYDQAVRGAIISRPEHHTEVLALVREALND